MRGLLRSGLLGGGLMALCGQCGGQIVRCGGYHPGLGRIEKIVEDEK